MFNFVELKTKKLPELQAIAQQLNVPKYRYLNKLDLINQIIAFQEKGGQTPLPQEDAPKKTVVAADSQSETKSEAKSETRSASKSEAKPEAKSESKETGVKLPTNATSKQVVENSKENKLPNTGMNTTSTTALGLSLIALVGAAVRRKLSE